MSSIHSSSKIDCYAVDKHDRLGQVDTEYQYLKIIVFAVLIINSENYPSNSYVRREVLCSIFRRKAESQWTCFGHVHRMSCFELFSKAGRGSKMDRGGQPRMQQWTGPRIYHPKIRGPSFRSAGHLGGGRQTTIAWNVSTTGIMGSIFEIMIAVSPTLV